MSIIIGGGGGRIVLIRTETLATGLSTGLFNTGYPAIAARVMIVVVITQVAGNGQWDLFDSTGTISIVASYDLHFNVQQHSIGYYNANQNNMDRIQIINNTNGTGTINVYAVF